MKAAIFFVCLAAVAGDARFEKARANGVEFERDVAASRKLLHAWLKHADPKTLLLPDNPGAEKAKWIYTPHNSGADLYPYLILTAELTDPEIYHGRMLEMLRNEVRYTSVVKGVPGNLMLESGQLGPASLFGAGEYAKDGLITVTEYLGRTPYFYRMVDMVADAMEIAPVETKFGKLPANDAELNGDYLQVLARLALMTGDKRFLEWGRRIADAYVDEVLPGNYGLPAGKWDFAAHTGDATLKLRDHGNETIVGLVLQYVVENYMGTPRAATYRAAIAKMLGRVIASGNEDGMLFNSIDAKTLKPVNAGLSDNWGYVYGAVYTFYMTTGEAKYRDAVVRVLKGLPKYKGWNWEPSSRAKYSDKGSFDGYADSIESAIYLVNREPVPEALEWIDSEMKTMLSMQREDGHVEDWYGEGNFNRTALLHALMKSAGVRPAAWKAGMKLGAVREGGRLLVSYEGPATVLRFDSERSRRVMNLDRNYVRLNEFPEWFALDANALYSVKGGGGEKVVLGAELIEGIEFAPGDWVVERR